MYIYIYMMLTVNGHVWDMVELKAERGVYLQYDDGKTAAVFDLSIATRCHTSKECSYAGVIFKT